jgi:cyclase
LAKIYSDEGADELVFLDITATVDKRKTLAELVTKVAKAINIPFTVGGGISTVEDVKVLLAAGADKISINSAAVKNPGVIDEMAREFGSQCIVVAIDAKQTAPNRWEVFTHGGRNNTGMDAIAWAEEVCRRGAGEILLTSMDRDGTKNGFDLELVRRVSDTVSIPVIASGGVGNLQDLADGILQGHADAVLAASIFHYGEYTVQEAKDYLAKQGIAVR